jgi:hypothetical protein
VWNTGEITMTGNTVIITETPLPVPLCPPQISYGLAWATARPPKLKGQ